jgi:hypothetical protein
MDAAELMNKLLKLERAIGLADAIELRNLVMDAQAALLEMQRHSLTALQTASRKEAALRPQPRFPGWQETAASARRGPAMAEDGKDSAKLAFAVPAKILA